MILIQLWRFLNSWESWWISSGWTGKRCDVQAIKLCVKIIPCTSFTAVLFCICIFLPSHVDSYRHSIANIMKSIVHSSSQLFFIIKFSLKFLELLLFFITFFFFFWIDLSKISIKVCSCVCRHGRSPQRRVRTQTTRCYPRLWSAGLSTCLRSFCLDTCRSSMRSTTDI